MSFIDEKHVMTGNAILIWDGITTPEQDNQGQAWTVSVALPANDPVLKELEQLATAALNSSEFKGKLPPGANWPFVNIGADKYDGALNGCVRINAKTRVGCPGVYDPNGRQLQPMEYGAGLYPGATVRIIAHAYAYNQRGNAGIAFGLDGIGLTGIDSPRLNVGGIDVAAAFGGQPATGGAPAAPFTPPATAPAAPATTTPPASVAPAAPGVAPPPHTDFLNPPVATGAAPPPSVPAPVYRIHGGKQYTEAQLEEAKWSRAQIESLPIADNIPF